MAAEGAFIDACFRARRSVAVTLSRADVLDHRMNDGVGRLQSKGVGLPRFNFRMWFL